LLNKLDFASGRLKRHRFLMRLLLAEDEPALGELLRGNLRRAGFTVDRCGTLDETRAALAAASYSLLMLDLRMPDGDGLDLLRELRRKGDRVPIIVTTARGTLNSRVTGLDEGADDYIVKPFAIEELTARIRALLRRPTSYPALSLGLANLNIALATSCVTVDAVSLPLTRGELKALTLLMRRAGRVVSRESLENDIYAFDEEVSPNALEATMHRLRRRLESAGAKVAIVTIRGVGYMIKAI
jgi:DNA-binding response OmpR family regulator